MRKTIVASTLALAAFAVSSEAKAAGWGLHNGDTLNGGDNMLYSEVAWPDFSLGFQHGMSSRVDLGFRFSLDYGQMYTTWTNLGLGMRVPIRIALKKGGKFSALLHIDPGVKFADFNPLWFGIQFPIGLEFGIHITPDATIQFGMDVPVYVNLTNGVFGNIPIMFGPGFEYTIDQHMAVGLNTRFGPNIFASESGAYWGGWHGWRGYSNSQVVLGLIAQVYFAYRL